MPLFFLEVNMNWLEKLIKENNITAYFLSKETNVTESTISRIIKRDIPREKINYGIVIAIDNFFNKL